MIPRAAIRNSRLFLSHGDTVRHTGGGKAAVASDKAKVNGRRREQAEATRIGEDDEE